MLQTMIRALVLLGIAVLTMGYDQQQRYDPQPQVLYRATCVSDNAPVSPMTFSGITFSGLTDEDAVAIFVGVIQRAGIGINTMTVDGTEMLSVGGAGGGTNLITGFFRNRFVAINNAASVDIAVTLAGSIESLVLCAWAVKGYESFAVSSGIATAADVAAGTLSLTTAFAQAPMGHAMGVCGSASAPDTTTWTQLTEREDSNNGELSYSNADLQYTTYLPAGSATLAATCDTTGSSNVSGSLITNR